MNQAEKSSLNASRGKKRVGILAGCLCVALMAGCATTQQGRKVETSGFLGDYSQLKEKGGEEALLLYVNPNADCKQYSKVYIEPVALWAKASDSKLGKLPAAEKTTLANLAMAAINNAVKGKYGIASKPGPDVLTLRAAVTEAEESWVLLDILSSIHPGSLLLSQAVGLATGKPSFTGEVAAELEAKDSVTGERLMAGVDKRVGAKSIKGAWNSWGDVEDSFQYWSDRIGKRMDQCRTRGTFAF